MKNPLARYALLMAVLWALLIPAALVYAQDQGIPIELVWRALPAFLAEAALYVFFLQTETRQWMADWPFATLALLCVAGAVLPYSLYSWALARFSILHLAALGGMAALLLFWARLPQAPLRDAGLAALLAAPVLLRWFGDLYPALTPRISGAMLGTSMWIRTGVAAVLVVRGLDNVGLGFLPRKQDWMAGLKHFVLFLPGAVLLAYLLEFARFRPIGNGLRTLALAVLTFAGVLWVLALAEEFYFRGMLQQWLACLLRSQALGLAAASMLFGAAHLWFRSFPNWRFALLATVAGFFYGRAYIETRSIRAPMVTHALVVTTWRVFMTS
jgi:membrane protease YdiL (CAAX protease family)